MKTLTIPEMLDMAINYVSTQVTPRLTDNGGLYLCYIYKDLNYPVGWNDQWKSFLFDNIDIAREKYAGDFWNDKIPESGSWWKLVTAEEAGRLNEVYKLKLAFLKHLRDNL